MAVKGGDPTEFRDTILLDKLVRMPTRLRH